MLSIAIGLTQSQATSDPGSGVVGTVDLQQLPDNTVLLRASDGLLAIEVSQDPPGFNGTFGLNTFHLLEGPVNLSPPQLRLEGTLLSVTPGLWAYSDGPEPQVSYLWQRAGGQVSAPGVLSYTIGAEDRGQRFICFEQVTDPNGARSVPTGFIDIPDTI